MLKMYEYEEFEYVQSDAQKENRCDRHDVVVVGGGPVGLTMALDLAARGIKTVLIDDNNTVSIGSRAVCYAKRTLEVWNRLGVGKRMVDKGVDWNKGKVFFKEELAYQFDLLPQSDHNMPAMINLQQYYLEEYLISKCMESPLIELRWLHKLEDIEQQADGTLLKVSTPDGKFEMKADWMIACDGASSNIRKMLNAEFSGQFFKDRFLIADVVMKADYPAERWFWFDPPFHPNQSVLLHKQSDNLWRIDFQLGWDADPEVEKKPENIIPRIETMLNDPNSEFGKGVEFELEWASIYQFACRRIDQFVHDRIIFAGDSAHQVSPFGARGANTGVQDVDNLAWKLELIINDKAPASFIKSYHEERAFAADDNLLNSTRSTDFITPKSKGSRIFRDAVLELAKQTDFAKSMVNSGRLSMPTPYLNSSLNTADNPADAFEGLMHPGTNCVDAPLKTTKINGWLLDQLGDQFTLICFDCDENISLNHKLDTKILHINANDMKQNPVLVERYDAKAGTVYLVRPDQYITMRSRNFDQAATEAAIDKAIGLN